MSTTRETASPELPDTSVKSARYRNLALIMGFGMFASTFAQTGVLGLYPFRFLLMFRYYREDRVARVDPRIWIGIWGQLKIAGRSRPLWATAGLLFLVQMPLFDLAARATPKGSEALGYSIIISVWNWGLLCSDLLGSALYENYRLPFKTLVWINAATTLVVLVAVPFLPKLLVDRREEE
ncbi:MAG: hypothetical protein K9N23_22350 [Akkermansiaceae bacterium]|nr:hypothetical protein [Akkermansiaceae bacterium]